MLKTLLLADDSPTIRRVVELTFGDTDIRVEAVASGQAALERLELLAPDIVVVDVVMPEPSGYELCRWVKQSARPVPVLLLAGTFEPFDEERARECGADGYLVKPFESSALVERVERLLLGAAGPPPGAAAAAAVPAAVVEEPLDELDVPATAAPDSVAAAPPAEAAPCGLSAADVDAVARAVIERLSDAVVREIAREVVPRLAESIIRERIHELEREDG